MSNNTLNTRVSDLPDHGSHNPTSKCCLAISVTSPHQVHVGPKLPNNYWCQTARLGIDSGYHCRGISHIYHIYHIYIIYICSHIFHLTYIIYHISQLLVLPWCFPCRGAECREILPRKCPPRPGGHHNAPRAARSDRHLGHDQWPTARDPLISPRKG